jgi:hypothetical protein
MLGEGRIRGGHYGVKRYSPDELSPLHAPA